MISSQRRGGLVGERDGQQPLLPGRTCAGQRGHQETALERAAALQQQLHVPVPREPRGVRIPRPVPHGDPPVVPEPGRAAGACDTGLEMARPQRQQLGELDGDLLEQRRRRPSGCRGLRGAADPGEIAGLPAGRRLLAALRTAISVTATPMTSSRIVVSMSARRVMVNCSYDRVRKKSNHTAADSAASTPASRCPFAATATTITSMVSAASVLGKPPLNGTSTAASTSEPASAASTASWAAAKRRGGIARPPSRPR